MPREASVAGFTYHNLLSVQSPVATGTSAEEYLTDLIPGFKFRVKQVTVAVVVVGAGVGATRLFRLIRTRGTTDTVVASKTIALADVATKGVVITFTNSTTDADLVFGDADKVSLDVTGAGTQFTALTLNWNVLVQSHPQQLA